MIRAQSTLCCILKFAVTIKNLSINRRLRAQRERESVAHHCTHTLSLPLSRSLADSHRHTHTHCGERVHCASFHFLSLNWTPGRKEARSGRAARAGGELASCLIDAGVEDARGGF